MLPSVAVTVRWVRGVHFPKYGDAAKMNAGLCWREGVTRVRENLEAAIAALEARMLTIRDSL